jgi:hypothetical protein
MLTNVFAFWSTNEIQLITFAMMAWSLWRKRNMKVFQVLSKFYYGGIKCGLLGCGKFA